MAKVVQYIPDIVSVAQETQTNRIRVAAYARVSTDKEEQEDSFERQVDYYTRYIRNKPEWEFAGIYADPGITGTRTDKRPDFQRLMNDCKNGRVQKILCKSVARFARNTVDALYWIQQLKELHIGVYFETENVETTTPGGEVMLSILASMAEQESRTISKNVRWAMQKKFQQGDFMVNYNRFLGYTRDENRNLVIVEKEAEIVRRIFREYIHGYGANIIARHLEEDGILTCTGKTKWDTSTIYRMLRNEKYCGCVIMGKTYKVDVLSKKRIKNDGKESQMYYAEDCIPPIIDKETFNIVQSELKRRADVRGHSETNDGRYTSKYALSKKVICGECGSYYRRHAQTYNGTYQATWVCPEHKLHPEKCHQMFITEDYIKKSFIKAMNELVVDMEMIKTNIMNKIGKLVNKQKANSLQKLANQLEQKQNQMMELFRNKANVTADEYSQKSNELIEEIGSIKKQKEELEQSSSTAKLAKDRLEEIEKYIGSLKLGDDFNDEVFTSLVEQIIVRNRYELEFQFKIGIKKAIKEL